jgi:hypothetical protein
LGANEYLYLQDDKWTIGVIPLLNPGFICPALYGEIAILPENCPEKHRCFIGAAFIYDNSIYPLSSNATYERLTGQIYFLNKEYATLLLSNINFLLNQIHSSLFFNLSVVILINIL